MDKIKVIAFDLGGVIFAEGKKVAFQRLKEKYNYDEKLILPLISARVSKPSNDAHRGLLDEDKFWEWVQKKLPKDYDAKLIKQEWWDGYVLDQDIYNFVKELKGKYKLVVFSGNFPSRVDYLEDKYHFKTLFDSEFYSFDAHLSKSGDAKEFLKYMLNKLEVNANCVAYIDDSNDFVQFARDLGLKGFVYKSGNLGELKKEMISCGINV